MRKPRSASLLPANSPVRFHRPKLYAALLAASQWMSAGQVWAGPEGGQVVAGVGSIQQTGTDTLIHQASERMAIDWRNFDVGLDERVEFIQPSSSSIALNRVLTNRPSEILGRIDSNGQVLLVNTNGIVFGKDAIINVGGMIASGLSIDPGSFINGDFTLNAPAGSEGRVINYGTINAATGGTVTLVGQSVVNQGLISANLGSVNLAAGNEAVLSFDSAGLVGVKVTQAVLEEQLGVEAAINNSGAIQAQGGRVLLTASQSEDVFSNAVNHNGMNRAASVVMHDDGSFTLGAGADVINTGEISVSAESGDAGQLVVLGENISNSGRVLADTQSGQAGSIELHSRDTQVHSGSALVSAQAAAQGQGGDVKLLGDKVGLLDTTQVSVAGANGGGQLLVGGDQTGANQQIRNAEFIYVGEQARLDASATLAGDGGKLITFAENTARIYGRLYARGGSAQGNGGFIETSGLQGFEILHAPDMGASQGLGGTWLIDPHDLTISVAGDEKITSVEVDAEKIFTSNDDGSTLQINTLLSALGEGNVIVQTGSGSSGAGNITVAAAIEYTGNFDRTLTLQAHRDININASIESTKKALNLVLTANTNNDANGNISMADDVAIKTYGGDFTATGVKFTSTTASVYTGGTNISRAGDINITITGDANLGVLNFMHSNSDTDPLTAIGSVTVKADNIYLHGALNFNNTGPRNAAGEDLVTGLSDTASFHSNNKDPFILFEATSDIGIYNYIYDTHGDGRDGLQISLKAGNKIELGKADKNINIYTGGGSFIAVAKDFDSSYASINTEDPNNQNRTDTGAVDYARNSKTAFWSDGGNVAITAEDSVDLGNVTTDGHASNGATATGNLTITNKDGSALTVSQHAGTALNIYGTAEFTLGAGDLTLANDSNNFLGTGGSSIVINSAENVTIVDAGSYNYWTSESGSLVSNSLTHGISLGKIKNISGNISFAASGDITIEEDIGSSDSYLGKLTIVAQGNVVANERNFFLSGLDVKGVDFSAKNIETRMEGTTPNTVSIDATGDVDIKSITTKNPNQSSGAGIDGGDITVSGKNITLGTIDASGSAGDTSSAGGNAGTVTATASGTDASITLKGNITTEGGTGLSEGASSIATFTLSSKGSINLTHTDFFTSQIKLVGSDAGDTLTGFNLNSDWDINSTNSGSIKKSNETDGNVLFENISHLVGGSANDIFTFAESGSAESIAGGGGSNTLIGRNAASTWNLTEDNKREVRQVGETENYVGSFSNINTLQGGTAVDTFNLNHAFTGTVKGGADNDVFNINAAVTTINGEGGDDSFVIGTTGSASILSGGAGTGNSLSTENTTNTWDITGANAGKLTVTNGATYVTNFSGIQTLSGGDGVDIFNIGAQVSGAINAGNGNNEFNINVAIGELVGGVNDDTFRMGSSGSATSLNGGGGSNTLIGRNAANTWNITEANKGGLSVTAGASYVGSFSNINTLQGGTAVDIFNLNHAFGGTVNGGAGNDVFNINAAVTTIDGEGGDDSFVMLAAGSATTIRGGGGANALTGRDADSTWNITGANAGNLVLTNGDAYVTNFSAIQTLNGGSGVDIFTLGDTGSIGTINGGAGSNTLIGRNAASTWNLTEDNKREVRQVGETENYVGSFSNINTLQGGTAVDTFNLNHAFGGTVNGGAGNDVFNINAVVNDLDGEGDDDSFLFSSASNAGSANRITGGIGSNTLIGRNQASTWTLTDANVGELKRTSNSNIIVTSFSEIDTLQGGTAVDTFNLNHAFTGTIKGGAGNDVFNINAKVDSVYGENGNDVFNINAAVTTIDGEGGDDSFVMLAAGSATTIRGGGGANALTGRDADSTWNITGANAGNLVLTNGDAYVTNFSAIQTLNGGSGVDIFTLGDTGSIGTINGGAGSNTLIGRNAASTWNLTEDNKREVCQVGETENYVGSFSNINTLQGGTAVDTFNLNRAFDGTVNGGADNDVFNINAAVTNVDGEGGDDSFFIGATGSVTTLSGGGTGTDNSLSTVNTANTWDITDTNKGQLTFTNSSTYVTNFSGIQTLNGGDGADTFTLGDSGSIGTINGGAGGGNTLIGRNAASTWNITGTNTNDLTVTNGATYVGNFTGIQTLQGGTAVDTFNLNHAFTGTVKGGAGNDVFNINAAVTNVDGEGGDDSFFIGATGSVTTLSGGGAGTDNSLSTVNTANTWDITDTNKGQLTFTNSSTYVTNFSGIQTLNGGDGADTFTLGDSGSIGTINGGAGGGNTLIGRNAASTWNITGTNTNDLTVTNGATYVGNFTGIQTLQGGTAVDTFNLNHAFTGTVKGGAGNDVFNINAAVTNVDGEGGDDSFFIGATGSVSTLSGGAGTDNSLSTSNTANTWDITDTNKGKLTVTNSSTYVTNFSGIQTLNGGDGADTFTLGDSGSIGTINGGAGGGNTLIGRNAASTWNITGTNTGNLTVTSAATYVGNFTDIETLQGGTAVDTFNLNYAFTETIKGGAGNDVFNINAQVNILEGEAGDDGFVMLANGSAKNISGGAGKNYLTGRNSNSIWNVTEHNKGNVTLNDGTEYVTEFTLVQSLNGGTGTDKFNLLAAIDGVISGGNGRDTFIVNASVGSLMGGNGNDSFDFSSAGNSGSAQEIDGGNGTNTIIGRNVATSWNITSENGGNIKVTGGSDYVAQYTNVQNLNGGSEADIFTIDAASTGQIQAGNGDNTFNINVAVDSLVGGDNNDQFIFGLAGIANSIDGKGGINSLTARNENNKWTITAKDAGTILRADQGQDQLYVNNFYNIQELVGGNQKDVFVINAEAQNIYGGAGDDEFSFAESDSGSAQLIQGDAGSNAILGKNQASTYTMVGANSGSVATTNNSYVTSFTEISQLVGGSANADRLVGLNQNNNWVISGTNAGTLAASANPAATVSFSGMENLQGNASVDQFTFSAEGKLTGVLDGGSSQSLGFIKDSLNLTAITSGVRVEVDGNAANTINIKNIESVTASSTGIENNQFVGSSAHSYRWEIKGSGSSTVSREQDPLVETTVEFTNFGDIRGGTNNDTFKVSNGGTQKIDGGSGSGIDLIDYSMRLENFTINLGSGGDVTATNISNIEGILGNWGSTTGYSSTIKVTEGNNTWTIGTDGANGDGINDGSITIGGNVVYFQNFSNLEGGSGNDNFIYIANGQWMGGIDGGDGVNTLNASGASANQHFFMGVSPQADTELTKISSLTGNRFTASSLSAGNTENLWAISQQGVGSLNSSISFSGITHLFGGDLADTFNFSSLGQVTTINGGSAGFDVVNFEPMQSAFSVTIDPAKTADITAINIDLFKASSSLANVLIASDAANTWRVTGTNAGTLNGVGFAGFANLVGGSANDTFILDDSALLDDSSAIITGHIDLMGGHNELDASAFNADLLININDTGRAISTGLSIANLHTITANNNFNNRIQGENLDSVWRINALNAGSLSFGSDRLVGFSGINGLVGGTADDQFILSGTGRLTGIIDGGAHQLGDSVDLSMALNANVNLASANDLAGYKNIEKYKGNNTNSLFVAANNENIWDLTGTNSGRLNQNIVFEGFASLTGGSKQDRFNIVDAIITGNIDGGQGNDFFTITSSRVSGQLHGGEGDDQFIVDGTGFAKGELNLSGGEGADSLLVRGGGESYSAIHRTGVFQYHNPEGDLLGVNYTGFAQLKDELVAGVFNIYASQNADEIRLTDGQYTINDLPTVLVSNKENWSILGDAADRVIIDGVVSVNELEVVNSTLVSEGIGAVKANTLRLTGTQNVGAADNFLNTEIAQLVVANPQGDIYLSELNDIKIGALNSGSSKNLVLTAGGDITSAAALSYAGDLSLQSNQSGIDLSFDNSFSGKLKVQASKDIILVNSLSSLFESIKSTNLVINSAGDIRVDGIVDVTNDAVLSSNANVSLLNQDNKLNKIAVKRANNIDIHDADGYSTEGLVATGNLRLTSAGQLSINGCKIECTSWVGATAAGATANNIEFESLLGGVQINADVIAQNDVRINSLGVDVGAKVNASNIYIDALTGTLNLTASSSLEANQDVVMNGDSLQQAGKVSAANSVSAEMVGTIDMQAGASTSVSNGNIDYSGTSLSLALLSAEQGTITTTASLFIKDNNGADINISGLRWNASAQTGIGFSRSSNGDFVDDIETDIEQISVTNAGIFSGAASSINIFEKDDLIIHRIANNGDINIANGVGDFIFDKRENSYFDPTQLDAREQGGVINANFGVNGGRLTMQTGGGAIVARFDDRDLDRADKKNPDIVAQYAFFQYAARDDFGAVNRKMVMHIPQFYYNNAARSYVIWYDRRPAEINDLSYTPKSLSLSDQLIRVEELSDIDPAVFTNVRNYLHDDVAIFLPEDQRFEEDEVY